MKNKDPQVDQFAIDTGQLLIEQRQRRHHEAINTGQICGWRALAAAIVVQGVRRAQGALDQEPLSSRDTVRDARRFVTGPWASYLLTLCDMDMEQVAAMRATWVEQWALEAEQQAVGGTVHEALPNSLVSESQRAQQIQHAQQKQYEQQRRRAQQKQHEQQRQRARSEAIWEK